MESDLERINAVNDASVLQAVVRSPASSSSQSRKVAKESRMSSGGNISSTCVEEPTVEASLDYALEDDDGDHTEHHPEQDHQQQQQQSLQQPLDFKQSTSCVREQLDPSELLLQQPLGSGTRGAVYRAIWFRTFGSCTSAIAVAVKCLHRNLDEKAQSCEAMTWQIDHQNLVRYFDSTSKQPYLIVSEYCAGGSFYDLLHVSGQDLTWCQRLTIIFEASTGMEYLHSLVPKLLHRDLKSANVLLTKRITSPIQKPSAKVADFGFCSTPVGSTLVASTSSADSWRWKAPEVFQSIPYDDHTSIDVFSFAMVIFETAAREVPYVDVWPIGASNNSRVGLHIRNGHRPNLDRVQSSCPDKVVEIMQVCWAEDPQLRPTFSTVREILKEELDIVMQHGEVIGSASF